MSTSGTVGLTTVGTDTLLDHALLRVGQQPAVQTPQIVQQCQESLYMLLLSLSSRGLNLWAVEKALLGLVVGQPTYVMPVGTLDVLNVIYSQPILDPAVGVVITNGMSLTPATDIIRVGIVFSASYTGTLSIGSVVSVPAGSYDAGLTYWFDLPYPVGGTLSITGTAPAIDSVVGVTQLRDLPIAPMNRDTYMALPDKARQSHSCVNYWYEKKLTPQITLWPVPDNTKDHLTIMRHRQVQDVGTLTQQIEVPGRWLEGITWQLSLRLAFELPNIDPNRVQMVTAMAGQYLIEAESRETDGMPTRIQPRISPYTR